MRLINTTIIIILILSITNNTYTQDYGELDNRITILIEASKAGNNKLLDEIISSGIDLNHALHIALRRQDSSLVKRLLKEGADPNYKVGKGKEPILISEIINSANIESIKYLIAAGADVNGTTSDGLTPLMWSSNEEHKHQIEIMKLLINSGAEVNKMTNLGYTALMIAAMKKFPDSLDRIKLLIKNDADLDLQNNDGKTLLIMAVEDNRNEIAKELIASGANINIKDKNDWTALRYAKYNKNIELIQLLMDIGGIE